MIRKWVPVSRKIMPNKKKLQGSVTLADGVRKDEEFSGTREVEERHRVNEANLDAWMREHVEGYQGPLTVLQFKGGQSNPTYQINTPGRSYVMRRRPFGKLLPSAHAVDREFRVIAALGKQDFPVARAYALCTDDAVIGSAFYIMSMEEGRVLWDPTLPSQTPGDRRKIFTSKIETLAKLHTFDPREDRSRPTSANPAIISRARSTAGPSSTAPPRPSTFRNSKSSPSGCRRRCRSKPAFRSSMATIASTT